MKAILPSEQSTNYLSAFSATKDELSDIISFLLFVSERDIVNSISTSRYAPSPLWKDWLSKQSIAFSLDSSTILLNSGHSFNHSVVCPRPNFINRSISRITDSISPKRENSHSKSLSMFKSIYPDCKINQQIYKLHSLPYLRWLENVQLASQCLPPAALNVLEIGSGAGVTLIERYYANPSVTQIVVDLPDTVVAAYLLLKSLSPELRIFLPNNTQSVVDVISSFSNDTNNKQFDIIFLLPNMVSLIPDGSINHIFNMSSFQEMTLDVVLAYFELAHRVLVPGSFLQSNNQLISRHIKDNTLGNWILQSKLRHVLTSPLPYANQSHHDLYSIKDFQGNSLTQVFSLFQKTLNT